MLDIVVMLFHILRAYLPSEVKWSIMGNYFDMFGWTCCMATVLYAVFWTVRCGAGGGAGGWGRVSKPRLRCGLDQHACSSQACHPSTSHSSALTLPPPLPQI